MVRADAVIVGCGATGTLVAAQLLRQSRRNGLFVLVEQTGQFSQGVAYGTQDPQHLLNVPASALSAYPGEPEHFLSWLRRHDPDAHPRTFAPRRVYARYLAGVLAQAELSSIAVLIRVSDEVVDIREHFNGTHEVRFLNRAPIESQCVVLAMGNQPPANPSVPDGGLYDSGLYRRSPWQAGAFDDLPDDASVLLVGSGLTMVDAALSLKGRGHRGPIQAISRHGLLPARHEASEAGPLPWEPIPMGTARGLLRQVRWMSKRRPWRDVIDGLRPHTQSIWRDLPKPERARFLRHARAYWEAHRHRMAPRVADEIEAMRAEGQLHISAGRLLQFARADDFAVVRFRPRGSQAPQSLLANRVINCTGPAPLRGSENPLVSRLVSREAVRYDAFGLGLETDAQGACLSAHGGFNPSLFAAGPLLRGTLWETTAIPEIRLQADNIARRVLALLTRRVTDSERAGTGAGLA